MSALHALRAWTVALLVAAVPALGAPPALPAVPTRLLDAAGWGPARLGMRRPQLEAALGQRLHVFEPPRDGCEVLTLAADREDPTFLLLDGRLARIEGLAPEVATVQGLQPGASEAAVRARLGAQARVSPHWDSGVLYTVRSRDGRSALQVHVGTGVVVAVAAGTPQALALKEGCS